MTSPRKVDQGLQGCCLVSRDERELLFWQPTSLPIPQKQYVAYQMPQRQKSLALATWDLHDQSLKPVVVDV